MFSRQNSHDYPVISTFSNRKNRQNQTKIARSSIDFLINYLRTPKKSVKTPSKVRSMITLENGPVDVVIWFFLTYISIITNANFEISNQFQGMTYCLSYLGIVTMFTVSQILYYSFKKDNRKLALLWLIPMFWGMITNEIPSLIRISQGLSSESILNEIIVITSLVVFGLKVILWMEVVIYMLKI